MVIQDLHSVAWCWWCIFQTKRHQTVPYPCHIFVPKLCLTIVLQLCVQLPEFTWTTPTIIAGIVRAIGSYIHGWPWLSISLYRLHLLGQREKSSQEPTSKFILTYQTVMSSDNRICTNVTRNYCWISQQASGLRIVELKGDTHTDRDAPSF